MQRYELFFKLLTRNSNIDKNNMLKNMIYLYVMIIR
jgi:hypothetical protein